MLTRAAGKGFLVQISIKAIKIIDNVLKNLALGFVRFTVVVVKKQFVLNILSVCL